MSGPRAAGAVLSAVLGAVLAVWVASGPAASAQDGAVRISTWNLEWLTQRTEGLPDDAAPKRDDDIAILAGYAARLKPTVAALEEVDDPALVARLFPADRYQVLMTRDDVVQKVALVVRNGVPVVRHPDLTALDVYASFAHHLRSGLDATLTLEGTPVRILAVHLKSGCFEGGLQGSPTSACKALTRQLPVLQAWIAARRAEGVAFLVLGDFNRRLKPHDALLDGLESAAPMRVATAGRASPCWGGEDFIDQILAGGPAAGWIVPDSLRVMVYRETAPEMKERLSDHCPVSVALRPG
jgi:endonuclease/exonuclease/phosphatase family metal-dependent hydrolase